MFMGYVSLPEGSSNEHVSHEKNPDLLSIESWVVNRDP